MAPTAHGERRLPTPTRLLEPAVRRDAHPAGTAHRPAALRRQVCARRAGTPEPLVPTARRTAGVVAHGKCDPVHDAAGRLADTAGALQRTRRLCGLYPHGWQKP